MQALSTSDFFCFVFFLVRLFYICTCLLLLIFLLKVMKNKDTIQTNQQISYQPDTDSLLNILHLI
jgi:hypothetical protein